MTEIENVLYTAKTHTSGDREGGVSRSSDGRLDVKFSSPGAPGNGTNPEQLFAAGWSACFVSAMKIAAEPAGHPTRGRSAPGRSYGPVVSLLQRHARQHQCRDQTGLNRVDQGRAQGDKAMWLSPTEL
jgi:hypothetical protein